MLTYPCLLDINTHTNTHTYTNIYIYIYIDQKGKKRVVCLFVRSLPLLHYRRSGPRPRQSPHHNVSWYRI